MLTTIIDGQTTEFTAGTSTENTQDRPTETDNKSEHQSTTNDLISTTDKMPFSIGIYPAAGGATQFSTSSHVSEELKSTDGEITSFAGQGSRKFGSQWGVIAVFLPFIL